MYLELVSAAEFNEEITTVHICGLLEGLFHKNRNSKNTSFIIQLQIKKPKIPKII